MPATGVFPLPFRHRHATTGERQAFCRERLQTGENNRVWAALGSNRIFRNNSAARRQPTRDERV